MHKRALGKALPPDTFGGLVQATRNKKNMTVTELAQKLGYATSYVIKIENGTNKGRTTLVPLSIALGLHKRSLEIALLNQYIYEKAKELRLPYKGYPVDL